MCVKKKKKKGGGEKIIYTDNIQILGMISLGYVLGGKMYLKKTYVT